MVDNLNVGLRDNANVDSQRWAGVLPGGNGRRASGTSRPPARGYPWTEQRPWLWEEVQALLRTKKWSPEQIAHRCRKEHPDRPEWWVSHEAIYQAVFVQAKGELREEELTACLRSGRARRRRSVLEPPMDEARDPRDGQRLRTPPGGRRPGRAGPLGG